MGGRHTDLGRARLIYFQCIDLMLTDHDATDTMPTFSPSGDEIAFTSTRDGDHEIYTLKIDQAGAPAGLRRITQSPGRDVHPKYSPDGKWIVFASERGGLNDEEPLIPVIEPGMLRGCDVRRTLG